MLKKNNYSNGQSLIEILIALSSIVLIISAVTIVTINSLNNSFLIKNQNLANKYAQEAMEIIRNWEKGSSGILVNGQNLSFKAFVSTFSGSDLSFCLNDISGNVPELKAASPACPVNVSGFFKRKVIFSPLFLESQSGNQACGGSDIQVEVNVAWSSSNCTAGNTYCHSSQIVSCFSNPVIKAIP